MTNTKNEQTAVEHNVEREVAGEEITIVYKTNGGLEFSRGVKINKKNYDTIEDFTKAVEESIVDKMEGAYKEIMENDFIYARTCIFNKKELIKAYISVDSFYENRV